MQVTAQDGTVKTYTVTVKRASSSLATLSSLSLTEPSVVRINTTSGPGDYNSTAKVSASTNTIRLVPVASDPGATIRVNGAITASGATSAPVTLNADSTFITVQVTASNNTKVKRYVVKITKEPASAVASLSKLSLVEPDAVRVNTTTGPGDYNSTAKVAASVSSIKVVPVATDAGAMITVNGTVTASGATSAPVTLNADSTFITVKVTAANKVTVRTYVVKITKEPASAVATLSKLYLVEPAVTKTNTSSGPGDHNSTASVKSTTNSIKVVAEAADPGATIRVNGAVTASGIASAPVALNTGDNTIRVEVTAANNTTVKTYVITVTKEPAPVQLSAVATLSKLYLVSPAVTKTNVSSGPADHNAVASVSATTKTIKVVAVATDSTATIRINGVITPSGAVSAPVTLNAGDNTINIVTTAQNGTTTSSWAIIVTKAKPPVIAAINNRNGQVDILQKTEPLTTETLPEAITVKQAVSPNGDGINDRFTIEGITAFPENVVRVMNRNGDVVYEAKGYDNLGTAFDGRSSNGTMQQPGTYFYAIEYKKGAEILRKTGYLVLKY
ncbi:hypothetical protein BC343_16000 [Mucilaginibacter pedocola]|uniref:Cadherin-like beta-sandwich-like domain-containing protein n=2 Tax=Mucilaginibacter pedocola TaxID=1792845 RepID=A0A1S9P864_9SPHI|nr:hypothetical protein BC343_16000 [Mucilaginibacter pedocola]